MHAHTKPGKWLESALGGKGAQGTANPAAAEVNGAARCFEGPPRRFGVHGLAADTHVIAYDPILKLLAVASETGQVAVLGGHGVEAVLSDEDAGEACCRDGLLFLEGGLLAAISSQGRVRAWDLRSKRLVGAIAAAAWSAGDLEVSAACSGLRHVLLGTRRGDVFVAQVSPRVRTTGYCVRREEAFGTSSSRSSENESEEGSSSTQVVAMACCPTDGALLLIANGAGKIVLWDLVTKKRRRDFEARPQTQTAEDEEEEGGQDDASSEDCLLTCIAWCGDGARLAAGFADGTYAVWDVGKSAAVKLRIRRAQPPQDTAAGPLLWVRTAVSGIAWVPLPGSGGCVDAWGLAVAGGLRIDEPTESDGLSLLVTSGSKALLPHKVTADHAAPLGAAAAAAAKAATGEGSSSAVAPAAKGATAGVPAVQALEIPLASGSERIIAFCPLGPKAGAAAGDWEARFAVAVRAPRPPNGVAAEGPWSEVVTCGASEASGNFLALRPIPLSGHLAGYGGVTVVASAGLQPAMAHLNFMSGSLVAPEDHFCASEPFHNGGRSDANAAAWLDGGEQAWDASVPLPCRDEALALGEFLVFGHADGALTFWEGAAPPADPLGPGASSYLPSSEPQKQSLLMPLGMAPVGGWLGLPGARGSPSLDDAAALGLPPSPAAPVAVTAIDILAERDADAAALHDACVVAVGLAGGEALALRLGDHNSERGKSGIPWDELAPIGLLAEDCWAGSAAGGAVASRGQFRASVLSPDGSRASKRGSVDELAAEIAAAAAEARAIADDDDDAAARGAGAFDGDAADRDIAAAAAAGAATGGGASAEPSPVHLVVRAHVHSISTVKLAPLGAGKGFALAVADTGGAVSISQLHERKTHVLALEEAPLANCAPLLAIGPRPSSGALAAPRRAVQLPLPLPPLPSRATRSRSRSSSSNDGAAAAAAAAAAASSAATAAAEAAAAAGSADCASALFVLVGSRMSVFDLLTGAAIATANLPENLAPRAAPAWLFCVDKAGQPLRGMVDEDGRLVWRPETPLFANAETPGSLNRSAAGAEAVSQSTSAALELLLLIVSQEGVAVLAMEPPPEANAVAAIAGGIKSVFGAAHHMANGGSYGGGATNSAAGRESAQALPQVTLRVCATAPVPSADGEPPVALIYAGISWAALELIEEEEEEDENNGEGDEARKASHNDSDDAAAAEKADAAGGCGEKLLSRALLVTVDANRCAAVSLLPSLAPVAWMPLERALPKLSAAVAGEGGAIPAALNGLGELTVSAGARSVVRITIMGEVAKRRLTGGLQRLAKSPELVGSRQATSGLGAVVNAALAQSLSGNSAAASESGGGEASKSPTRQHKWKMLTKLRGSFRQHKGRSKDGTDGIGTVSHGRAAAAATSGKQTRAEAAAAVFDQSGEVSAPPPRKEELFGHRGRGSSEGINSGGDSGLVTPASARRAKTSDGVDAVRSNVSEGIRLAHENIEKLENTEQKTRELQDNAQDFRDMARELQRRQEKEASECIVA